MNLPRAIRVVLADDHRLFRAALRALLQVMKALRAGAVGYLAKTAAAAQVVAGCLDSSAPEQSSLDRLTPRQRAVLQLVAEGHTTKQIARKLGPSTKTAEGYRAELMKQLDIPGTGPGQGGRFAWQRS